MAYTKEMSKDGIKIRMEITRQSLFQNKLRLLLFCLTLIFSSCYTVNEHTYLNITFNDNKLNPFFLEKYVDSIRNYPKLIHDSINEVFFNGDKIPDFKRIVYFKHNPEEWYLVVFDSSPCWIEAIYNPLLSNGMIHDKKFISGAELNRIKKRFEVEVLKKAEEYGKNHHLADSVLYNLN